VTTGVQARGAAKRLRWLGLALLVLLPAALRLWPIDHGMPRNYVVDTHIVRGALGMAQDRDLSPPPGRYSNYPNLLPYVLLPVFAGEYAVGRVLGEWGSGEEFGARLKEDPWIAHLTARIVIALLSCLAPFLTYRTARVLGLERGAWVAAYLVATSLLHVHLSVQERPWALLCTFSALAAWPAALHVRDGRVRDLMLSGVAASLAFATHQAGGLVLGISGVAWLFGPLGWRGGALGRRIALGFACVGLFAAVGVLLGYPYLVFGGGVVESAEVNDGSVPGASFSIAGLGFAFAFRWESTLTLLRAFVGYDPVLLVLGSVGLVGSLRSRTSRPLAAFAVFWALVFFLLNQADHVRYLAPLTVLLAWPAGRLVEGWMARGAGARLAVLVVLALPLVQAVRLGWVLRQDDTRALAEEALLEGADRSPVAIDPHGPRPPMTEGAIERLGRFRPLGAREAHRRAVLAAGGAPPGGPGVDALPLEAIIDTDERSGAARIEEEHADVLGEDPNAALRRLGIERVLLVDKTPGDGAPPLLLSDAPAGPDAMGEPQTKMAPLDVVRPPIAVWDPGVRPGAVEGAMLPSELPFALTDVWRHRRPGPRLELYRLRSAPADPR